MPSINLDISRHTFHTRWRVGDTICIPVEEVRFSEFTARLLTASGEVDVSVLRELASKFTQAQYAEELAHDLADYARDLLGRGWQLPQVMGEIRALLVGDPSLPEPLSSQDGRPLRDDQYTVAPGYAADEHADELAAANIVIPDHRVICLIGAGGMSRVYLAEDLRTRRMVAAKLVSNGSNALHCRAVREIEFLACLEHPGIARLYDAGRVAGRNTLYFTMELVSGEPLDDYVRTKLHDLRQVIHLFLQVLDAIQYCHKRGVLHRDLKPSNIIVGQNGMPKIIDFGVSKACDAERTNVSAERENKAKLADVGLLSKTGDSLHKTYATMEGAMVGTLPYMSPEQVRGDNGSIDARTDIYTFGTTMWVCLFAEHPLGPHSDHSMLEWGKRIVEAAPTKVPASSRWSPTYLVADVVSILHKCLEKQANMRYGSACEVASDLKRALDHRPLQAQPPSVLKAVGRAIRRNKAFTFMIVITVVSLLFGAVSTALLLHRSTHGPP